MDLYNDDCFNVFPKLKDKSIDLFVLDLPYGQTACKWDSCIDLTKMWVQIKRIMKPNAVILFYCTTKFGYKIIQSNEKWFRYDLIWKKSRKVGFLSANKMPLRQHENIYVFSDDTHENKTDINNERNKELRSYAEKVKKYIGKSLKIIDKKIGNQGIHHFYSFTSTQFGIPTEETYNKLIELYNINEMEGFIDYKTLKSKWEKHPPKPETTYIPQKTEGKPYKNGAVKNPNNVYRITKEKGTIIKTDRHPTSIIEHENIYVFSDADDDLENKKNKELRSYAEKVKKYIGKSLKIIDKKIGNQGIHHFYSFTSTQFGIPIEKNYNKLIEIYKINEMEGFIDYNTLKSKWDDEMVNTYNPQKTEGKPYKPNRKTETNVYGTIKLTNDENKGDRHPTSIYPETIETTILAHNNPVKSLHRTQKPTSLCEWLIKTYSNEGDTVMDFTMGSGTTGEACKNTKRKFIGVEMDKDIFKVAKDRLDK